ncbi:MAG: HAMP domain-containing sensor histidine kinase [Eubacteriales bacterium]|nr:HAMP domain-containing sensor histidine kinase [Eubacteriales bacterium]
MAVKKITKRWLFNSFFVILFILSAIIIGFSVGIRAYYYNGINQSLIARANIAETLLKTYEADTSVDFSTSVRYMVETFDARDKMELIAIGKSDEVIITSSGFEPDSKLYMPDYYEAQESPNRIGTYRGYVNGENIMAVTVMCPVENNYISAVRFVVSLTLVDRQIVMLIALIGLMGMAIIFFVILSSSYFINSIVNPVGEIGDTARKISAGDFGVRLKKLNDDEVGDLCDIINDMAEELQTTEKMKNEFISSVSHELRTPLTAIKGWGETILQDGGNDRVIIKKGINVIINETERLSGMVEELLDFSRIQDGHFKLNMNRIDILAELGDAVLVYGERAKRDKIDLIYDEPEDIIAVYGDKNRLRQVFINIIDNALKYSDPGDSVTITAKVDGENILIRIKDTGIGIKAKDLPAVKTKFYKANTTRRGSGIGLAVADEIINMHGGRLEIDSVENVGTTVSIYIPIMKNNKKHDV